MKENVRREMATKCNGEEQGLGQLKQELKLSLVQKGRS